MKSKPHRKLRHKGELFFEKLIHFFFAIRALKDEAFPCGKHMFTVMERGFCMLKYPLLILICRDILLYFCI